MMTAQQLATMRDGETVKLPNGATVLRATTATGKIKFVCNYGDGEKASMHSDLAKCAQNMAAFLATFGPAAF